MTEKTPRPFRTADLSRRATLEFRLAPDADARAALAADLDVSEIRKLRFDGTLIPEGKSDWRLEGKLGATVVQPCVVTLTPVVTRIEEAVSRRYLARWTEPEPGSETEMPEDDSVEPLGATIDPSAVMAEALSLAIPDFPRAEGVELGAAVYTEPGAEPLTDDKVHPFAVLARLRKGEEP